MTPQKTLPASYLEGLAREEDGGKATTHLGSTTKDQYWTKIEPRVGNDLVSRPWKKKNFNIEKPFKVEKIFVCKRKYFR